jgi:hypothetical protein
MALRYLVSGGNGNSNSTTNWSASSGGASGASVPGTVDDIVIDINSLNAPLTFNANMQVRSITVSDYIGTLTINSGIILTIFGNGTAGFILFSSVFIFTGDGTLRFLDNNASTLAINVGTVVLDVNVLFTPITSAQPCIVTLQSNIVIAKNAEFRTSNTAVTINGAFNITCLGDVKHGTSSPGANNAHFTLNQGSLIMAGTTPQVLSSDITALCEFRVRMIFNSTSDILVTGRYRIGSTSYNWFTWISGNVTSNSTQDFHVVQNSIEMNSGPIIWNRLSIRRTSLPQTITLFSDFYCKILSCDYPNGNVTSSRIITIQSNNSDTRKFIVVPEGTQTDIFQLRSTAQIDSNGGQTIWSFNGTNAPSRNWRLLLPPKTYAQTFIG